MKWRLRASTLVIASLMATPALAQDFGAADKGIYSTLLGGIAFGGASDIKAQGTEIPQSIDLGKKTGWALSGAGGYDWGLFRTELEASMRRNSADGDGGYKSYGLMANLLGDLPLNDNGLNLYAGGGVGFSRLVFDGINSPHAPFAVTGGDTGLAYQLIAGLRIPFAENIFGQIDYRFFDPKDADLQDSFGRSVKGAYSSNTVMIGVGVLFGGGSPEPAPEPAPAAQTPPPPPPPPPAQEPEPAVEAPTGPFLVFFDWDSANVSSEARDVLEQAADSFRQHGRASIELNGYADRSGPQSYNMRLSQERADSVKEALESMGIDSSAVSTQAFGEEDPLVPTPDGVREPQNRRVQIKLGD